MNTDPVKILITGDFCPHNRIQELALKSDYPHIFHDFLDVFEGNDLNITDLECPLTTVKTGRKKTGPHQKANPLCINILKYAHIQLAALANNHMMDYGSKGAQETIELCLKHGIQTVGAGQNKTEAQKPFITTLKNKKFAFINAADMEFLTAPDGSYQANAAQATDVFYQIQEARESCDYVVVLIHGGNEFYHLPSPGTKKLYRFFVDAGSDAVVSNHTHCYSGYEIYHDKPIFYGLGNFIYDWPGKVNSDWNKGYAVRLIFGDNIAFDIIPLNQCNETPGVFHLNQNESIAFQHNLKKLNEIIADDKLLCHAFHQHVDKVSGMYDAFIEPYFGRIHNALRQRHYLPNLLNRKKRLLLLNLIRCEAHREVLIRMLKQNEL